ncbi:hypothetical protein L211DRAFT_690535 [Terfezia boudieri ATCC MYA-4762]|uniref:Uncharacterized protein n=1 Tax=Terfezia boudieri ATCC MYA-4762 TaxID=1051890 RepID=A0A3N4L781_9PEZI|nr:hypothetical protein L211DRAFT_690535 [Terfezia boudieri ATCC MYA-4762]
MIDSNESPPSSSILSTSPSGISAPQCRLPMRRWIEEDNKGAQILGIRLLLQQGRRVVHPTNIPKTDSRVERDRKLRGRAFQG